jgi:hypothetical protein
LIDKNSLAILKILTLRRSQGNRDFFSFIEKEPAHGSSYSRYMPMMKLLEPVAPSLKLVKKVGT